MEAFEIRGFNPCESLLRHKPEQLRTFIRRMKTLNLNTLIVHYDYGWKRYKDLIIGECEAAGVEIILMTFGPRTFLSYSPWKSEWFAKKADGTSFTENLECETYPCAQEKECLEAYDYGARQWLKSLPVQIKHVHMRAADGLMFCQCEKCRKLPDYEKWQPFVDIFTRAVMEERPNLCFETDVYVKRYHIPQNSESFGHMGNIMYDTFYRHTAFPIGSTQDEVNKKSVCYAATEKDPDATTPNEYHLHRLKEWCNKFPGKVYIHENAMGQSLYGQFQYATGTYLKDLELYRSLGVKGVCYEAYEPGYEGFSGMFETLARALNGEEVEYEESDLEKKIKEKPMWLFCVDPDFPLEEYIKDPVYLKQAQFFRQAWNNPTAQFYRDYVEFSFEHEEIFDPIYIGFAVAVYGYRMKKFKFTKLSPQADDMLHRRKLWDFMEDIPLDQDPWEVCRELIYEFMEKVQDYE